MSIFMRWPALGSTARRRDHAAALAEADAGAARAIAVGAEDDLVAVLQEAARLAVRQGDRIAAARGELEQAAAALVLRPRAGAAAHEVADLEVAAVAGVMRDHLRDRPVDGG